MKVITFCGSLKYQQKMMELAEKFAFDGWCVLTPVWPVSGRQLNEEILHKLKEAHLKRIELSDVVFIANIDDYIGNSTLIELEYAKKCGKQILFYTDL